ncbi:MAG: CHASE2 domain-containing protein [Tolypothrix brevis GSE-NOS-MK-07-07A]|jgi:CHASE2 domain-containing sensor protein|nr:CHASE2 domain-containing protein [Tolypothrix brevis GSE-NOS-MK-07-07A]MBW4480760.1 CHASE2 domain-containing protein [Tolypothrix brevis GSE-NOS-MK-07-07A]
MSRLVVLSLGQGNLEDGFPAVTVQLGEQNNPYGMKFTASLPAAPEISIIYSNWRSLYLLFHKRLGLRLNAEAEVDDDFEIESDYVTNISEVDLHDLCEQLDNSINTWLNSTQFHKIDQQLRTQLEPSAEIRFIIETNDNQLRHLPWHLWNFFTDYPCAEVALSAAEYQQPNIITANISQEKVKILAIFGDSQGIKISQDRTFLEELSHQAEIEFLVEPSLNDLNDRFWKQNWDILFFAGHSCTKEKGWLQLNHTDSLTLNQLKYALSQAIARGLKLAIFNSCDGLGLAQQLQSLQIPQVIVMREPVPDVVAQNFLKYFLAEFSRGQSLYAAVRYARERLQGLEKEYPCATWLPVICQNPAVAPMIWSQSAKTVISTQSDKIRFQHSLSTLLIASILVGTLVMGVRYLGVLQPWELQSYDHLMQLRSPDEKPDSRLLIVTIDEADIQYQIQQKMNLRWSLSDQAFNQLLQKLDSYQPKAIGIDIYHDFPFDRKYPDLINRLKKDDRLFAVCKVAAPIDKVKDGVPPPPHVPIQRQSFSDFVADEGDIARRQLLHLTPPAKSTCVAEHSFNFQLAQHYLNAQGIRWKINSNKNLQIGDVEFKELKSRTSGYQKFDASGYQILLNYRSLLSPQKIARQVALKDILSDQIKPELIESLKNRIVLIGVTASSSSDYWKTPYSSNAADNDKQIPGVFVQAQMISQILSAVLDKRPLLWWWSGWMEALWVWGWSLLGGIISWRIQQPFYLGLAIAIGLIAIFSICFSIFTLAGWIPLIPSALALIISAVVLKILPRSRINKKHLTS